MNALMEAKVTAVNWRVSVPAGTYFLGDPCYAVPGADWLPLLESCGYFGSEPGGSPVGTVRGWQVLGFHTRYGDGEYRDQRGHVYGVDAGLIGLTPKGIDGLFGWRHPEADLVAMDGQVVTFEHDIVATSDGTSGVLLFGRYRIDTGS